MTVEELDQLIVYARAAKKHRKAMDKWSDKLFENTSMSRAASTTAHAQWMQNSDMHEAYMKDIKKMACGIVEQVAPHRSR